MSENGKLPQSELEAITKAVNGEQAYLRSDAAKAFKAMNSELERRFGVTLRSELARAAYRPLKDQEYFWQLYQSGKGNLAARPGTSNHGLGLAIDLATQKMRQIVDEIGAKYGWAKQWSDAPTEWWHLKWKEGNYTKAIDQERFFGYTTAEKAWIKEYDRLVSQGKGILRRRLLRSLMTTQRKAIYRAATKEKNGWTKKNRTRRYNSLKARTS